MLRRLLSLIVLAGLVSALAAPLAAGIGRNAAMACCRGGAKMACCVPSAGCEMKSCPGGDRDPVLPGLEPAVLESAPDAIELTVRPDRIARLRTSLTTFTVAPPDQPPRG